MTLEIALVLGVVVSTVILFATERLPVKLIAMLIMGSMPLSGIVAAEMMRQSAQLKIWLVSAAAELLRENKR